MSLLASSISHVSQKLSSNRRKIRRRHRQHPSKCWRDRCTSSKLTSSDIDSQCTVQGVTTIAFMALDVLLARTRLPADRALWEN